MVRNYIKTYKQRWQHLTTGLGMIILVLIGCSGLFYKKLIQISSQLNQFDQADYSFLYILNKEPVFDIETDVKHDECLFPRFDIFLDQEMSTKLNVESLMKKEGAEYHIYPINIMNSLNQNEVILSKNSADKYDLHVGDTLYTTYSIYSEPEHVTIKDIVEPNYGFINPVIDNETGVIYFGYMEDFHKRVTSTEYISFSENEFGDQILHMDLQILNSFTRETTNYSKEKMAKDVFDQGKNSLIWFVSLFFISIVFSHWIFFRRSKKILQVLFLKGMQRRFIFVIPFFERLIGIIFVTLLIQLLLTFYLPLNSSLLVCYHSIPIILGIIYITGSVVFEIINMVKISK